METDRQQNSRSASIYARGADDGFWMGLYFIAIFAMMVGAVSVPFLNVPGLALILGVPFLTYFFLRRTYIASHGLASFSALWMEGIVMFACGSLVFGAAAFVYMRWIAPDFILDMVKLGVEYYGSSPAEQSKELASEFQSLIDMHRIPSPLDIVMGWLWLGVFSGSLLSMAVSAVVRLKRVPVSRN